MLSGADFGGCAGGGSGRQRKRQEIIPESAMGRIAKSGHLHGEKDENVSHRVQPCTGDFIVCGYPCTQDAVQSIIDDGNYSVLAVG